MAVFMSFAQGGREEMVWQPEGVWMKQECWRWKIKNIILKKKNIWLFPIIYHLLTLKFAPQVQRPESQTKMVSCLSPLLWPTLSGITSPHFSLIIIKPPLNLPSHPPETIMTDHSGTSTFIWIKTYKHPPVLTRCKLCRGCQRGIRVEPIPQMHEIDPN